MGLDIRKIQAWGWLDSSGGATGGGTYRWTISRAGVIIHESSISIAISARHGWARLMYTTADQAAGVNEVLTISQIRGRWYWHCPCGGRALVLYKPPGRRLFRCRRCCPVVYQSSRDSDQRVSDTYRNLIDQINGRADEWLDSRRLIWTLKAMDRLDKKLGRPDQGARAAQRHARWLRRRAASYRRSVQKRWANYRRREARRAARIAAHRAGAAGLST